MKRLLILLLLTGCTSVQEAPINETQRQAVYATHDAISAGRFDQADQFSTIAVQLIPPPKTRIPIFPIVRKK